jgi:hypothetical protein
LRAKKNTNNITRFLKRAIVFCFGILFFTIYSGLGQTVQTFSNSGSWTVPADVSSVTVYSWGAGGGGGGSGVCDCAGGGGGGGAISTKTISVSSGQTYTITIGTAGSAGSTSGGNGGNGGTTTFTGTGGTCSAAGGTGGTGGSSGGGSGGPGGSSGNGYLYKGGNGASGYITSPWNRGGGAGGGAGSGSAGVDGSGNTGGSGGTGTYTGGTGGNGKSTSGQGAGSSGSAPGGGGGGAGSYSTGYSGGSGAAGQVVIIYTVCASPSITSQPSNSTVCSGSSASFSVSASGTAMLNYQWKENGVNLSNGGVYSNVTTSTLNISNSAGLNGKQYSCYISNSCGNITSNAATLTVDAAPSAGTAAASLASICDGASVNFSSSGTSGTQLFQYQFDGTGGVWTDWFAAPQTWNSAGMGGHTAYVRNKVTNGVCAAVYSAPCSVAINALPSPIASNNGPICAGNTLNLAVGAYSNYNWTGPNSFSSSIQNPSIGSATIAATGTYTVTVTDGNSCQNTSSTSATVNATSAASISIVANASTICAGTNVTFTATPTNGGATPTYQWKLNGGNVGTNSPTYSNSSLVNGNQVSCVMTSSNTCATGSPATSNLITMTVNANPTAAPGFSSNPICNGSSTTLSANASAGSGIITTYSWSSGIAGNNVSGSVSNAGTYTVTVTNSNSCTTVATSASLAINPVPTGGSMAIVNYCTATGSGTVTVTGVSNVTQYSWSLPAGLAGSSTTSSISVSGITAGSYTITVTPQYVSGGVTCNAATPVTGVVNVVASPTTATNTSSQTVCAGTAATLSGNNPSVGTGAWSVVSGPNTSSTQFANTAVYNTTFTPTIGGSYVVRWTITNAICSSYTDATITVNTVPSQPSTISGPTPACYTSSQTYSVTNVGGVSYSWNLPSGWTGSSTTNSISATVALTSGNITVTPSNGCGSGTPRTLSVTGQVCDAGPYNINAINGATTTIPCGYITRFYDSGGSGGNYGSNENYTTTFKAPAGKYLAIAFSNFHTEECLAPGCDILSIYNGPNTGSPLIGNYYGTYLPPTIYSSLGGYLTFKFVSDGDYNWPGFSADLQCVSSTTTISAVPDCDNQACLGNGPVTVSCIGNGTSNGGSVNDLSNGTVQGCLADGERNSSWFYFDISASGTLRLNITPTPGPAGEMYEYDFALYKLDPGDCPLDHNTAPVRCSYADGLCQPWGVTYQEYTGINSTQDADHSTNCWNNCDHGGACSVGTNSEGNDDGNGWVNDLPVTAGEHYVLVLGDNIMHNSGWNYPVTYALTGTATYCCSSTTLPVELTEFSGKCIDGKVKLGWTTASETNNDYFKVEKSKDGNEYYSIGTVEGSGNSNELKTYYFTDEEDGCLAGCYYRLQQFDYDGASEYSDVIRVECSSNLTSFDNFSLYPNPATDMAFLDIISPNDSPVDVLVFNNRGQQVFEKRIDLIKGYNQYQLSTSSFSNGIYCVVVTNNYRTKSKYILVDKPKK